MKSSCYTADKIDVVSLPCVLAGDTESFNFSQCQHRAASTAIALQMMGLGLG